MGCAGSKTAKGVYSPDEAPNQDNPASKSLMKTTSDMSSASSPTTVTLGISESESPASKTAATAAAKTSADTNNGSDRACFGAGCYWGTEKFFRYDFSKRNGHLGTIVAGMVGFMGPANATPNPAYSEVCKGNTGHVEVYDLEYTGGAAYYEALVKFFFQFHDPTTLNKQGNDRGTQYASVIYCYTDEQFSIATRVKEELQALLESGKLGPKIYANGWLATDIRRATTFYPAHDEHQDYLNVNPHGYCNHRIRFKEWP